MAVFLTQNRRTTYKEGMVRVPILHLIFAARKEKSPLHLRSISGSDSKISPDSLRPNFGLFCLAGPQVGKAGRRPAQTQGWQEDTTPMGWLRTSRSNTAERPGKILGSVGQQEWQVWW